jgi:hypothetical protein
MCLDALTQIRYTRGGVRWEAEELELVQELGLQLGLQLVLELGLQLELEPGLGLVLPPGAHRLPVDAD